jgi:tRNA(Arg) A34 adenosine deaminase TadA
LRDVDPTAHAEVAAVRRACSSSQTLDLSGATIFSSCEPCAVCLSVAAAVGISEIVYAAPKEQVGCTYVILDPNPDQPVERDYAQERDSLGRAIDAFG